MSPDRDYGGKGYQPRALTPAQAQEVAAGLRAGVRAIVLAERFGCSVRTIYRYADRGREHWVRVVVGDWAAEFVITEWGPVRCTPWLAA